jgi:hypothetical protein
VAPGDAAGAAPAGFRPGPAAGLVGMGRGGPIGCLGATGRRDSGGGAAGDGRRRRTAAAAAGAAAPVRSGRGQC